MPNPGLRQGVNSWLGPSDPKELFTVSVALRGQANPTLPLVAAKPLSLKTILANLKNFVKSLLITLINSFINQLVSGFIIFSKNMKEFNFFELLG